MKRNASPDLDGEGPLRAFRPGEIDGAKEGSWIWRRNGTEIWWQRQEGRHPETDWTQMAGSAVGVRLAAERRGIVAIRVTLCHDVLMRMVAEMLRCLAFLVLAIRSRNVPGHLERQCDKQQEEQEFFHGEGHCNRYRVCAAMIQNFS